MSILLIIAIIYLISTNSSLKNEISKLNDKLNKTTNFCPNCGFDLNNNISSDNCSCNVSYENTYRDYNNLNENYTREQDVGIIKKNTFNKESMKNTLILIIIFMIFLVI